MDTKMPRGAIPSPRSELAASDPYRPGNGTEIYVPSGEFPAPNHELSAAQPYRARGDAPESFLGWPKEIDSWVNNKAINSNWAEEAFAKACAEPKVAVPADVVQNAAKECGSSNFAQFMRTRGFRIGGTVYLNGPFHSLNWTNTKALNDAIANSGPVKIGVASTNLRSSTHGQVTPGKGGWAIYGLSKEQPEDECASLCGYGSLAALANLFERNGVGVNLPPGMPEGLCYAMFLWGSIGIVDAQSLTNITGEAWVRNPTTIVKKLNE